MPKVMTIRPPEELRKELKQTAAAKGYTVNQLVLTILWDWCKTNRPAGAERKEMQCHESIN